MATASTVTYGDQGTGSETYTSSLDGLSADKGHDQPKRPAGTESMQGSQSIYSQLNFTHMN